MSGCLDFEIIDDPFPSTSPQRVAWIDFLSASPVRGCFFTVERDLFAAVLSELEPSAERQEGGDMLEGGRAGRGSSVGAE